MHKLFKVLIISLLTCANINICNSIENKDKSNNQQYYDNLHNDSNTINEQRHARTSHLINKKLVKTNTSRPDAYILEQYFNKNYYNNEIYKLSGSIKNHDTSYKDFVNSVLKIFKLFQFDFSFDVNRQCIYNVLRNIHIDISTITDIAEIFDSFKLNTSEVVDMLANNNKDNLQLYINNNNLPSISLLQLYYYIVNQSRKLCAQTMHSLFRSHNTNDKIEIVYNSFSVLQRVIDKLHVILDEQFGVNKQLSQNSDNNSNQDAVNNSINEEEENDNNANSKSLYRNLVNSLEHCQEELILKSSEFNPQFIILFNNTHENVVKHLNKLNTDGALNNIIKKINTMKSNIDSKIKYQINKFHKINVKNTIHKYIKTLSTNLLGNKSINYNETSEWQQIIKALDDLSKCYKKAATIVL